MNPDIELSVVFRFLGLTDSQANKLKSLFPLAKFGTHFKTKLIVGRLKLCLDNIEAIDEFIENENVIREETDIYISFLTEFDSRTIEIPRFVATASSKLDSRITLSYTIK